MSASIIHVAASIAIACLITSAHSASAHNHRMIRTEAQPTIEKERERVQSDLNAAASALWKAPWKTRRYVKEVKDWGRSLHGLAHFHGTVFYPFGGGDVLNALSLFPTARKIVLAALIPVGDCQHENWGDLGKDDRAAAVARVLHKFENQGFLKTPTMNRLLDSSIGITPLVMAALHNMRKELVSIDCGRDAAASAGVPVGKALKITFRSRHEQSLVREITYVQQDLLAPSRSLDSFLGTLQANVPLATMIKSAEYHCGRKAFGSTSFVDLDGEKPTSPQYFSSLGKFVLENSAIILQDDTGFRLACLSQFKTTLHGTYEGPAIFNRSSNLHWAMGYDDGLHAAMCDQDPESKSMSKPVPWGYSERLRVPSCPTAPTSRCSGASEVSDILGDHERFEKYTGSVAILARKSSKMFGAISSDANFEQGGF